MRPVADGVLFNCVETRVSWPLNKFFMEVIVVCDEGKDLFRFLERNGIHRDMIKVLWRDTYTQNNKYKVFALRYSKKLDTKFEAAMNDLTNYLLAFGYPDYEEVCDVIFGAIDNLMAQNSQNKQSS